MKKKFNTIDFIIIAVVVAGVAFGGYKYISAKLKAPAVKYSYVMYLDSLEQPNEAFGYDKINVGDKVIDKTVNASLGKITSINTDPTRTSTLTDDGEFKVVARPNYAYLSMTIEGEGVFSANGGLLMNGTLFFCNKSYEVIIGDSLFWLRIVRIEKSEIS